jgi:hypothetical protein
MHGHGGTHAHAKVPVGGEAGAGMMGSQAGVEQGMQAGAGGDKMGMGGMQAGSDKAAM